MKVLINLALSMALMWLYLQLADAARIKDLAKVQGVRSNQLIGYGLVVGLPGTGEKNNAFSEQTFRTMLNNFGIKVPDSLKPKIKDVAPVAVHADRLVRFQAWADDRRHRVSHRRGQEPAWRTLLQTFLKGVDGRVHAVAQGSLVVGGLGAEGADGSKVVINTPTALPGVSRMALRSSAKCPVRSTPAIPLPSISTVPILLHRQAHG